MSETEQPVAGDPVRDALDKLANNDGSSLSVLFAEFQAQLAGFYFKNRDILNVELPEFIADRILELGQAWKTARDVRSAVGWSRVVLARRSTDVLRALRPTVPLNGVDLEDAGENGGEERIDDASRSAFLQAVLKSLSHESRMALFLTENEGYSQTGAAEVLLLAERAEKVAEAQVESLVIKRQFSAGFAEAKCYLLNDRSAALLPLESAELLKLIHRAEPAAVIESADIARVKVRVNNLVRGAKFRFHHEVATLLPETPSEISAIWKAMWPNLAQAPKAFKVIAPEFVGSEKEAEIRRTIVHHAGFLGSFGGRI